MAETTAGGTAKGTTRAKAPAASGTKSSTRAKPKTATTDITADAPATGTVAIREQVSATADTIRAEAQRKVNEIGDEVSRLYAQAGDRARDAANQGKHRAAGGLESLAKIIEDSATDVDDRLGKHYGDYARSAAQTVASLAGTLDEKDLDELVTATREFVRKSPAVAIGSAAVVGFMLARLLRSRN